jgi:hypothetical protein
VRDSEILSLDLAGYYPYVILDIGGVDGTFWPSAGNLVPRSGSVSHGVEPPALLRAATSVILTTLSKAPFPSLLRGSVVTVGFARIGPCAVPSMVVWSLVLGNEGSPS